MVACSAVAADRWSVTEWAAATAQQLLTATD